MTGFALKLGDQWKMSLKLNVSKERRRRYVSMVANFVDDNKPKTSLKK